MPADVEPVGEAPPDKLCDEREQPEGKPGKKALMPSRPIHVRMVLRDTRVGEVRRRNYPTVVSVQPPGVEPSIGAYIFCRATSGYPFTLMWPFRR